MKTVLPIPGPGPRDQRAWPKRRESDVRTFSWPRPGPNLISRSMPARNFLPGPSAGDIPAALPRCHREGPGPGYGIWMLAPQELQGLVTSGHSSDYEPVVAQGTLHYPGQASIRYHQQNRPAGATTLLHPKTNLRHTISPVKTHEMPWYLGGRELEKQYPNLYNREVTLL